MPFNPHFTENEREYLDERIAIALYEGGLEEEEAETLAYCSYIHRFRPDMANWYPWPAVR